MQNETLERASAAAVPASGSPTTTLRLVRADDQLDILIELLDAVVDGTNIVSAGPAPAVRFTFGPQHISERSFTARAPSVDTNAADHVAAGPSVVVASIEGIEGGVPFTVDGILGLAEAAAGVAGQTSAGVPDGGVTAIEVPTGLLLSTASPAKLVAARAPFAQSDTTEVWAASLEPVAGPGLLELSAIQNLAPQDPLTKRVPDAKTRDLIVANSTTLAPMSSRRLLLTSSGAFAELHGEWDAETGLALYDHRIAAGRDLRVEVVSAGYLLPFGHRAAINQVTERVFVDDTGGGQTSVLQTTQFLKIIDPVVTTPRAFTRNNGHGLPLMALTASTDETTAIRAVTVKDSLGVAIDGASDIKIAGTRKDLTIDYLTVDRAGNTVTFAMPATFIDDGHAYQVGAAQSPARLRTIANSKGRLSRRKVDLEGQPVAYADPIGPNLATKATHGFTLTWEAPEVDATEGDLESARTPAIYAALAHAEVVDDVIGSVTGELGDVIGVTLHPRWLSSGNQSGNFDLAFLHLDDAASSLIGDNTAVGGVAQLEVIAEEFNQSAGVGPDLNSPTEPFEAQKILGDASKIIGNILLSAVVDFVEGELPGLSIPGTTVKVDGATITVDFTFCPTLHDLPAVGFRTVKGKTRCCVHITTIASIDGSTEASFTTEMRVENFFLDFPPAAPTPFVTADFESVVGTINSDGSTSIVPKIREWDFSGTLSMLVALVDHLGIANVDLKILDNVVDMDTSIKLPDVPLGVAELKNFGIDIGFDLPLDDTGTGQLSLAIGKKSSPVDIDVMSFGGTFWLDLELGFSGGPTAPTRTIGVGLSVYWEMLDFDIVVAHVSFTLRLSADWKLTGDDVVFTGAVSLEGEVDVLGLVSVSSSIVASLTYDSSEESMILKGTLNYCADCFLGKLTSGSVPIARTPIELGDGQSNAAARGARTIRAPDAAAGSPSFGDRYTEDVWNEYCAAFA